MRPVYDTEWMGIPFSDLPSLDRRQVPGAGFYEAFYAELHRRYSGWEDLDPKWRAVKEEVVDLIGAKADPTARILSVGCGIGFVEKRLFENGFSNIEVQETNPAPLRWLSEVLPPVSVHVGDFPQCLGESPGYDLIYLSAVDYCFDKSGWVAFLRLVGSRLAPGGQCLVVSPSVTAPGPVGFARFWLHQLREWAGTRESRQRWGWGRAPADHRQAFDSAGIVLREEGFLPGGAYWILSRGATPR